MKAVIVYESLYGNTAAIAAAVADGLRQGAEVALLRVGEAGPEALEGADLLVVGGPTHVHGLSSRLSYRGAADDAGKKGSEHPAADLAGPPLRDWLDGLTGVGRGAAAAFDTRVDKPRVLTGSAARGAASRLRTHGYAPVASESFLVSGTAGPLLPGELDRASAWGRSLAVTRLSGDR
jgi:hypothetical protein